MCMRERGWRICSRVRGGMGRGGVWKGEVGTDLKRDVGKDL
jgi:hypothetical protein